MITIKAKIDIGENGTFNSTLSGITPDENTINVSSSFKDILGKNKPTKSANGFILGKSRLGHTQVYVNKLPYFVSRQLSDYSGVFSTPYVITLRISTDVSAFTIVFDERNGAHPNSIKYKYAYGSDEDYSENNIVYDDDARFEINIGEPARLIEITIDNWNMPNSPFVLTGIYAIGDFEITSDNLVSFNDNILDRGNVEYPDYGLVSNTGNLTFIDFDRTALDLITKRILTADKLTTVWVNNITENVEEQICKMAIQSLNYNNDNLQVSMQLKDDLKKLQNIFIEPLYVDPSNLQPQTAKWYYEELYKYTVAAGFDILSFDELDSDNKTVLYNTVIEYPLLDSDTLWNEWDKICKLCLCHMYVDNNNRVVLKYSGGN